MISIAHFLQEVIFFFQFSFKTPLYYACDENKLNIVKYLIDQGCNFNSTDNKVPTIVLIIFNKNTLLHSACNCNNISLVKYLVEKGLYINSENEDYETPLFIACSKNEKEIIKYLIDKGADVMKENKEQFILTPFSFY